MGRKNLQQKNKQTDQNKTLVNITDLKVDIRMMDKKNQTECIIMIFIPVLTREYTFQLLCFDKVNGIVICLLLYLKYLIWWMY